jgi:hypothetical protein
MPHPGLLHSAHGTSPGPFGASTARLNSLVDVSSVEDRAASMTCAMLMVQDNLNTHTKTSLYEAFPAAEARRLAERFEWHYTPKHGSWLDMAESELGVLASQCINRRISDKKTLIDEIAG